MESERRQRLAPCHLSPQQHRAAEPPSSPLLNSPTPQLPNSQTRKLSNCQTSPPLLQLPNSQTVKLSNSQTVKLSNFPSTLQLSTPQLLTPHLSPYQHYLNSSLFILHSSFNYNFCNCIFFISILYF